MLWLRRTCGPDLVGQQGCGAALPNLQTARSLLAAGHYRRVLSICVAVCSAAFYLDDDAGVLISACLFGYGAAAASASANGGRRCTEARARRRTATVVPEHGLLRNILMPEAPALAATSVGVVSTTPWPAAKWLAPKSAAGFCTPVDATRRWPCSGAFPVRPRSALERRGVARTRHEQPVRLVRAASRARGSRAGRLVVDDRLRRGF